MPNPRSLALALAFFIAVPAGLAASPLAPAGHLSGAAATLDAVELVKKGGRGWGKRVKVRHVKGHRGFYRARFARRAHHRGYRRGIVYGYRWGHYRRGHFHCHRHWRYGHVIRHCHRHRHGHH